MKMTGCEHDSDDYKYLIGFVTPIKYILHMRGLFLGCIGPVSSKSLSPVHALGNKDGFNQHGKCRPSTVDQLLEEP